MAVFSKEDNKEYIYKNLGKAEGDSEKLFSSMKDVYMIAFLLGAIENEKKEIRKKSKDPIKDIYFDNNDKLLMELVALDLTKDINILNKKESSQEYIHSLVEEFANWGIDKLNNMLNENHIDLDNLINCIKEYEKIEIPKKVSFEDLMLDYI
ncbi:hypothetical protein I3900191A7_10820 [Clostridium baratii]|uniref:hypothetical protein n=1 Tax=Clostridium baratii TaxID=1561 RepID=UPI0030CD5A87